MMFVKLYVLENMHCLKLYRQEEILVFLPFLQDRFLGNLYFSYFCIKHIKNPCRSALFCTAAWENNDMLSDQTSSLVWVTVAASRTRRMALLVRTLRITAASNSASQ